MRGPTFVIHDSLLNRISTDPDVCHGRPCVRGDRNPYCRGVVGANARRFSHLPTAEHVPERLGCEEKRLADVFRLEVWIECENLLRRLAFSDQTDDRRDRNPQVPQAGDPSHSAGIGRDSLESHGNSLCSLSRQEDYVVLRG